MEQPPMIKIILLILLVLAVSAVAIADIFLKTAATKSSFMQVLKSPWTIGAILLYLFQIFFFAYIFFAGYKLSLVAILQTGLYALVTLAAGFFFFRESLTMIQTVGIVLTLAGVILLNF